MSQPNADELGLGDYVALVRRRWRWVVVTMVLVVGVVAAVSVLREKTFETSARVLVLTADNQGVFNTRDPELFRVVSAEVGFMTTDRFAALVEEEVGRGVDFEVEPRVLTSGEDLSDASVLHITAQGSTAAEAQEGADAVAQVYMAERLRSALQDAERETETLLSSRSSALADRQVLYDEIAEAQRGVSSASDPASEATAQLEVDAVTLENSAAINSLSSRLGTINLNLGTSRSRVNSLEREESTARLASAARLPTDPESPDVTRNVLLAAAFSLILGLILAVLRDLLDPTAHDGADLARMVEIPVMATIGEIRTDRAAPGRVRRYRDLSIEESGDYQVLLNSLWLTNADEPLQSIVLTSDRPEVGKTQTVVNLAQAEAARGTRVLVIDTDFVNPSVADRLDVESGEFGLADLLEGRVGIAQAAVSTGVENLDIVGSNGVVGGGELLRSDRLGILLADLYASYDLILIDSPPTLSTSDSRLVASQADAVVVVYDPAQSRREELQRTIDLLRGARANLIGLVANRSRASHPVYLSVRER